MQTQVTNIIKDLAKKYNLPIQVIDLICTTQYKSAVTFIRENQDATIMLPNWGKYITSKAKVKRVQTLRDKKLLKQVNEETNILSST